MRDGYPECRAVAFLLFCLVNVAVSETIFSARTGPFNFPKDADEKKISVEYGSPILEDELIQEQKTFKTVSVTNSKGQNFICILPNLTATPAPSAATPEEDRQSKKEEEAADAAGNISGLRRSDPETLLDAMKKVQCSYLWEGWWTYEFCYKKHVRQFHIEILIDENGVKQRSETQEFILGKYDDNESKDFQAKNGKSFWQRSPKSQTSTMRYHAHIYNNGTKCDLTQEHRQTEVRFLCSESPSLSIKESPSCKYTLLFYTPILCKHVGFREISTSENKIMCHPLQKSGDGELTEDI